jgi:uncharacterized coiled-coil DUF342 family protein
MPNLVPEGLQYADIATIFGEGAIRKYEVNVNTRGAAKVRLDDKGNLIRDEDAQAEESKKKRLELKDEPILINTTELRERYESIRNRLNEIRKRIQEIKDEKDDINDKDIQALEGVNKLINNFSNKYQVPFDTVQTMRVKIDDFERSYRGELTSYIYKLDKEVRELVEEETILKTKRAELNKTIQLVYNECVTEEEKKQIQNKNICGICLVNTVNRVFVPCGHVICSGCAPNVGSDCFMCRKGIRETIPFFLNVAGEDLVEANQGNRDRREIGRELEL